MYERYNLGGRDMEEVLALAAEEFVSYFQDVLVEF